MGIKVRGVKQSKAGLNRIINDVKGRKVVRALQSAMIIGSSQAALYTPIDTSMLLNSQYPCNCFSGRWRNPATERRGSANRCD